MEVISSVSLAPKKLSMSGWNSVISCCIMENGNEYCKRYYIVRGDTI